MSSWVCLPSFQILRRSKWERSKNANVVCLENGRWKGSSTMACLQNRILYWMQVFWTLQVDEMEILDDWDSILRMNEWNAVMFERQRDKGKNILQLFKLHPLVPQSTCALENAFEQDKRHWNWDIEKEKCKLRSRFEWISLFLLAGSITRSSFKHNSESRVSQACLCTIENKLFNDALGFLSNSWASIELFLSMIPETPEFGPATESWK